MRSSYRSLCVQCGEVITSAAAETRHIAQTDHRRFETLHVDTPRAATIDPLIGEEWDRRVQDEADAQGAWL